MKRQTDLPLLGYINKYGCFFMSMVYWFSLKTRQVDLDYKALNTLWDEAIRQGAISGDMNGDGDMNDADESLIMNKDLLLKIAALRLKYVGSFPPDRVMKLPGNLYIGEFYNERTKFTHFVALDDDFKVEYDPIMNSVTAREGVLKTVRVFS